ncbi:MAG TPA: hypothetical protein VLE72_00860 [Candidatus Saccharimonadales bacterium]|nr:hypothetical protein [Candidatus Saccharimonadales bacterium]
MYSPKAQTITYDPKRLKRNDGKIGLLHEIGHAYLGHKYYTYDMQLLTMEMDAWDFVRRMAMTYSIKIDEAHINRCIASYDEWLSKRATCPSCDNFSLQSGRHSFSCFICGSRWTTNQNQLSRVKRTVIDNFERPRLAHN